MKTLPCFSVAALVLTLGLAEGRTWKEAGSARTIEGDFLRTEGDSAVIVRPNGTSIKVPLARLSDEDKKFIEEAAASKPAAEAAGVFKWETDFDAAKQRAKDEDKPMLLDFTGSDWCGWCIRLKKEVFDTKEFKEFAKDNLVLVEVDFPQQEKLPSKVKKQNDKLAEEYKVGGYPTIVLLNSKGREVARTGYKEGGPAKYIEHLQELLKK
jgi:thioredoxin-related protein